MSVKLIRRFSSSLKHILDGSLKARNGYNQFHFLRKDEILPKVGRILLPGSFDKSCFSKFKEFRENVKLDETPDSTYSNEEVDEPPLPSILSVQNPYTWLVNRFDMKLLQSVWDPAFKHEDFVRGSKQAVARVTQLASEGNTSDLHGLISRRLLVELKEELTLPDTGKFWAYLSLNPSNLVVARPRRVLFQIFDDKRFGHIDMMFVGMKWLTPNRNINGLMYLEIFARFRREYTLHCISDWTIVVLLITKCDVLARVPRL